MKINWETIIEVIILFVALLLAAGVAACYTLLLNFVWETIKDYAQ